MNENTREVLTSAEIEEGILQVSRHLGATPCWITRLLAGGAVTVERWQLAYFAAWKARFGVTETEKPWRVSPREDASGSDTGAPPARPVATDTLPAPPYAPAPTKAVEPILVESKPEWHEPTSERTNEPEEEPPW